jgi:ABC-2 type transport system ATP-binding protein
LIEAKRLSKTYKDGTKALSGVSFKIGPGITAILGRNGAGKTTLMRILSTQLMPTSGAAKINGIDAIKEPDKVRGIISSIPQEVRPMGFVSLYEHLIIYLIARGFSLSEAKSRTTKVIKELNLQRYKDKAADELSGGTKRKIFVAMALASGADIIFLDEPTTGLDPISRIETWNYMRRFKGTVVLTTHYMEEAKELASKIIMIDSGKLIAQGTIASLLSKYKDLVRVEGVKTGRMSYEIGGINISYMTKAQAKKYVGREVSIKKFDIEDLFLMRGIRLDEGESGEDNEY